MVPRAAGRFSSIYSSVNTSPWGPILFQAAWFTPVFSGSISDQSREGWEALSKLCPQDEKLGLPSPSPTSIRFSEMSLIYVLGNKALQTTHVGWTGPLGFLPTRHLGLQSLGPSPPVCTPLEGGCFLLYSLWCVPLWLLVGTAASRMPLSSLPDDHSGQVHAVPGACDPPVRSCGHW